MAQEAESSWNHTSHYGEHSANSLIQFGNILKWNNHDFGRIADFGGNDGYAASRFEEAHGVAPTVFDCLPSRLEYAEDTYGLDVVHCFLESIPVATNSFDWGFCSHVVEHLRNPMVALHEMARTTRRMVYFVIPVEPKSAFNKNHAHNTYMETADDWKRLIECNGFLDSQMVKFPDEVHLFARC